MKVTVICLLVGAVFKFGTCAAQSIYPGAVDSSFRGPEFGGTIQKIQLLPDGGLAIQGTILTGSGFPDTHLAVVSPEGVRDRRFVVDCLLLDMDVGPTGTIFYVTYPCGFNVHQARIGTFEYPSAKTREILFPKGTGARHILALRSGKVLVSGILDQNEPIHLQLKRYNSDLTSDPTWPKDFGLEVYSMLEAEDGSIFVGGNFSPKGLREDIFKLHPDGTIDSSFDAPDLDYEDHGVGIGTWVLAMALDAQGRLWAGGSFNLIDQTNKATGLVRLKADGSIDQIPLFDTYYGGRIDVPSSLVIRPDGGLLVAKNNKIHALETSDWTVPVGNDLGPFYTLAAAIDGGVYAAGDFKNVNGIPCSNLILLWADNIRPRLGIAKANDAIRMTLQAKRGSTVVMEHSADMTTWNFDRRFTKFSGIFTNLLDTAGRSKFIRARHE